MIKKITLILLSFLLVLSGSPNVVLALQSTHEVEYYGNGFFDVLVNKDNGRFSIRTNEGHPLRNLDKDSPLLFIDEHPDTSFTTFRIDGEDYIFGEDYGFWGLNSSFSLRPTTQGLANHAVWQVKGIEIAQTITLVDDVNNPNIGNVKIAYKVTNTTNQRASVGSRILLDTMLGAQDGSPISLSGSSEFIRTETDLRGSNVPPYWRAVDDPITPRVMTYGFLTGWDNRRPDRMVIAHWEGISATTWDYTVQNIDFTTEHNPYGSRDSAVALYWNPQSLSAGQTMEFETYYGLGSFFTSNQQANYGVQFVVPRQMEANSSKDGYELDTFDVHVIIDNTLPNARSSNRIAAEIGLPLELELAPGEQRRKVIQPFNEGEVVTVTWQVKAIPQQIYKAARYWVTLQAGEGEETTHAEYIILPALSGAPPQLQLMDLLPRKKFIADNERNIQLKGRGFSALVNNWDVELRLIRERDGEEYRLMQYTVLDDGLVEVVMNELWEDGSPEPGRYTLQLDAGDYGSFDQALELTLDTQFQSRSYGLLAIVKQGLNYRMEPIDKERSLSDVNGEVLISIRGDIREIRSGGDSYYEVAPGATLNSVILFDDNQTVRGRYGGSPMLRIEKNGNTLRISGTGVLSIPNFPFVMGPFSTELRDGISYALEPSNQHQPVEIRWALSDWLNEVAAMSFFPVTIKNAVIGKDSVYFGGSLSLNFGGSGDGQLGIGLDVERARFGLRNNQSFGFIGLRTEGMVGLPKDLVPGLNFGAEARVLIDTLQHIYEVEADVNFKVIETGGLFTLRFINNSIPILDNFEFYVGGKPGIPLIPKYTVAYITRGGGGFNNLYDTVMGRFNILPPLTLVALGGMSIGNILFADDMRLEASLRGLHFESSIAVMDFTIFDKVRGSFLIEDSLWNPSLEVQLGAEMSIFDVIEGNVAATISYDPSRHTILGPLYMSGSGNVSLQIPRGILFIGGKSVGSAKAYVSTEGVSASARLLNIPINMKYAWGDRLPRLASLHYMPADDRLTGLAVHEIRENGLQGGMITYGSNLTQVSRLSQWTNQQPRGSVRVLSDEGPSLEIPVGEYDYALIELAYSGEVPELEVRTPSGQGYELIEDENYLVQQISADESQSGLLEQYIYITIVAPEPGVWTVVSDKPLEDGRLMDVAELPVIDQLMIEEVGTHELAVAWQSAHVQEGMRIALYMSEDGDADSGRLLASDLPSSGTTNLQLSEMLPSGEYYIRAALMDGEELLYDIYSSNSFAIQNPHELPAPEQVRVQSIGNGFVQVQWDYAEAADGFVLQAMDMQGNPLPGIGMIQVEGDLREANIGGTYEDLSTGELLGLHPGSTYRIEVTAYTEIGEAVVYGRSAISDALYVPVPDPAQVDLRVQLGGAEARQIEGDHGDLIYIVNQPVVDLVMQASQRLDAEVFVNQESVSAPSGDYWQQAVTLKEGLNFIEAYAINEHGDMTIGAVQVRLDTMKPDLKIETPGTSQMTSEPMVRVEGVAEPGSTVRVNGKSTPTDAEGRFAEEVSIAGYFSRDITVTAEDEAGNRSVYTIQVINEAVESIASVEIRLASGDDESVHTSGGDEGPRDYDYEMRVNERVELQLVGIDEQGDAYILHPDRVDWDLLLGQEWVSMSDGIIQTHQQGDIVVLASYQIASDYALQHAYVIRIAPEDGQVEPPNYDDWYDENWRDNYPTNPPPPSSGWPGAWPVLPIDRQLQSILQSIIEAEQGTVFLGYLELTGDEDLAITIENRAELKVFAQAWGDEQGIGIGKATNLERFRMGGKQLIGNIYEIITNKPVRFEQPSELSIRFGLEEVEDPNKLAIYWYNERHQRWEYMGGQLNAWQGTITANLPHFSQYALLYDEDMRLFADVGGRWSSDAIYRLASIGVIDGWLHEGEWVFAPTASITRQEFIKLLVAAAEVELSASTEVSSIFEDRDQVSEWAIPYLNTAIEQGWVAGAEVASALQLQPLREITRAEAAVMLSRMHAGLSADTEETVSFTDASDVPEWARQAVFMLESQHIITGYPDGAFRPMHTINREEAAAMILKFMEWTYQDLPE